MLALGTRIKFIGKELYGTVIGQTFYHRTSWKTMEPGYVVELDQANGGYIDNPKTPSVYVDSLIVHVTAIEEV